MEAKPNIPLPVKVKMRRKYNTEGVLNTPYVIPDIIMHPHKPVLLNITSPTSNYCKLCHCKL